MPRWSIYNFRWYELLVVLRTYFIYFLKIVCISCLFTQFIFHLEGRSIPTICGTNNGAHLYVDFPSDMITMFINTSGKDKLIFHINQVKICTLKPWYNKQVHHSPSDPFCSLYRIIHYIKCNMLSKSSKWELGLVHYSYLRIQYINVRYIKVYVYYRPVYFKNILHSNDTNWMHFPEKDARRMSTVFYRNFRKCI